MKHRPRFQSAFRYDVVTVFGPLLAAYAFCFFGSNRAAIANILCSAAIPGLIAVLNILFFSSMKPQNYAESAEGETLRGRKTIGHDRVLSPRDSTQEKFAAESVDTRLCRSKVFNFPCRKTFYFLLLAITIFSLGNP